MPRKTDTIALNDPFLKRSVKLLPCQKEMIAYWYGMGHSIRGLAKMFKVNKRTIQFILFPERLEKCKQHRADRGGSKIYYNKEKHTTQIREHRDYKSKTLKSINNTTS
jgi:transposase